MSVELFYFPTSHWSRIVTLALAEKGINFERKMVDIRRNETFDPEYMRLNPRGVVPTLRDGETVVWNGPDIVRHLDALSPQNPLLPEDEEVHAWAKRLEDFPVMLFSYSVWVMGKKGENSASILDDKVARAARLASEQPDLREAYLRKRVFFEAFRAEVYDDEHLASMEASSTALLDELGERVRDGGFACGDAYSFADCIATSILFRLVDLGKLDYWHADPAHGLSGYFRRLRERPSFRAVFVDDPLIPERYRIPHDA